MVSAADVVLGDDVSLDAMLRVEEAGDVDASPVELAELAADPLVTVRTAVADNPSTPAIVLTAMVNDPDELVQISVAENPNVPIAALAKLARSAFPRVRETAAQDPRLPASCLRRLVVDQSYRVRAQAFRHERVTAGQLGFAAVDPAPMVRLAVAAHRKSPSAVLKALACDPEAAVAREVFTSPTAKLSAGEFRPGFLAHADPAAYARLRSRCADLRLFDELATTWSGSTEALCRVVDDTTRSDRPGQGETA